MFSRKTKESRLYERALGDKIGATGKIELKVFPIDLVMLIKAGDIYEKEKMTLGINCIVSG